MVLECSSGGLAAEGWPKVRRTLGQNGLARERERTTKCAAPALAAPLKDDSLKDDAGQIRMIT